MFDRVLKVFQIEWGHFKALSVDVRRLLLSYTFFVMAYPLIAVFIDVYLWRATQDLWSIVMYNIGYIFGLPIGFYLNGLLLKKIHILRLYFLGAIVQGVTICLVVFIPVPTIFNIIILGLAYGLGAGLYWANKNYLTLLLTRGTNRVYFNSIEEILGIIIYTVVPFVVGWFIVLTGFGGLAQITNAYRIVMVAGFIFLLLSGAVIQSSKIKTFIPQGLVVRKPTKAWTNMRIFNVLLNMQVGLSLVISSILVILLIGGEGILGTLQSITSIVSALMLYIIGRKATIDHSWKLVGTGSIVFLLGATALAGTFSWSGALVYSLITTIVWTLQWASSYAVSMELMDKEEKSPEHQYAYVCDNEIFFNVGRFLGIAIVVGMVMSVGQNSALQWTPLVISVLQLPLSWFVFTLIKHVRERSVPEVIGQLSNF